MNEDDKLYIAGIYNYCDRWCEKCTFTSHCLLFTNESKIITNEILRPGSDPDIEKIFNLNFNDDHDANDDELDDENLNEDDNADRNEILEINNYPLSKLADNFYIASYSLIKKMDEKYNFYALAGKKKPDSKFNSLFEEFETLVWFYPLITAKIKRAVCGKLEIRNEDDEDLKSIREYDMNGSAKISIIALEKTIKALNTLFDKMPHFKEEISCIMVLAGELLNLTENEFPEFNSFIRPGFDE